MTQPISNPSKERSSLNRVAYVFSEQVAKIVDRLPSNVGRSSMVHSLVHSYELMNLMKILTPFKATGSQLRQFHSKGYIDFLASAEEQQRDADDRIGDIAAFEEECVEYGLEYDCPVFDGLADYVSYVAGGTIQAAEELVSGSSHIVVHWDGGRHHAKKDEAHGFCYVNDIVLGILKLQSKYSRIMYIDLDLHHGDGVEGAFSHTDRVLTLSFHMYGAAYPGTGSSSFIGSGKGIHHTLNVPLKSGLCSSTLVHLFQKIAVPAREAYDPCVVVLQLGADGLVDDPCKEWNLGTDGLADCVKAVISWGIPVMALGGGGYHHANTARFYALVTDLLIHNGSVTISDDIPDTETYFEQYGADFRLNIREGNQPDQNVKDIEGKRHTEQLIEALLATINKIRR